MTNKGMQMIKLTNKEKAVRYDAIQTAIKYTVETYKGRAEEAAENNRKHKDSILSAYDLGVSETLKGVILDLERWKD